jgi:hypothetical protein
MVNDTQLRRRDDLVDDLAALLDELSRHQHEYISRVGEVCASVGSPVVSEVSAQHVRISRRMFDAQRSILQRQLTGCADGPPSASGDIAADPSIEARFDSFLDEWWSAQPAKQSALQPALASSSNTATGLPSQPAPAASAFPARLSHMLQVHAAGPVEHVIDRLLAEIASCDTFSVAPRRRQSRVIDTPKFAAVDAHAVTLELPVVAADAWLTAAEAQTPANDAVSGESSKDFWPRETPRSRRRHLRPRLMTVSLLATSCAAAVAVVSRW